MAAYKPQPVACTLLGKERQDRLAWIAKLMRDALQSSERDDLILRLRFAPASIPQVRDMVRKEQACCGFLSFEIDERPEEIYLTIRAPEAARAAADELFEQFATFSHPQP